MAITSASSTADIEAAYLDNSDYEAEGSVVKCQAFVQACRALLLRRPSEVKRNSHDSAFAMTWSLDGIRAEMDAAKQWLAFSAAGQAGGGVTFPSFSESRDYDSGAAGGSTRQQPYGDQQS